MKIDGYAFFKKVDKRERKMKKDGCAIAGGILQIIGGAFWLLSSLIMYDLAKLFNVSLELFNIILPLVVIIQGVKVLTPTVKKSDLITFGVTNLLDIAVQFFLRSYIGFGYLQMVLLLVSSILFFVGKVTPIKK